MRSSSSLPAKSGRGEVPRFAVPLCFKRKSQSTHDPSRISGSMLVPFKAVSFGR
jgi:hypothetical protein